MEAICASMGWDVARWIVESCIVACQVMKTLFVDTLLCLTYSPGARSFCYSLTTGQKEILLVTALVVPTSYTVS